MALRLVLVEDHQMTLVGLRMILEQQPDLTVLGEADTGNKAVRVVDAEKPDLVLMDIGLPEMDGIEATQTIKAKYPGIKVMMLTSKDNEQDVFAALAAGADAYCMKGVAPETLITAIHAVADGTAWLDPAIARVVLGRFQGGGMPSAASASEPAGPPADCPLTEREMEVLRLIVDGLSNPEIADKLYITKATAKAHVHSILQKLCVDDRTQAAVLALREGYVRHS
jgi:DNA-binding NarL/FixJ family response regulator